MSTYGEGDSFFVNVPQTVPETTAKSGEECDWTPPLGACILVVDDMKTNLMVEKGILASLGINADCAESGRKAIEKMERQRYDLVLLDHMMPEMDGEETLRRIKSRAGENFENIPVIALTANVAIGGREEYIRKGFSDYIPKPVELEQLKTVLRKYL